MLELSYGSRTQEFEDEDEDESEVLAAHDIIDAERFADRHEETDTRSAAERAAADRTWAFGHIVVDEAQELSAMAWRLLMRRCPSRSMTLVGDPAQTGDAAGCDSWQQILEPYVGKRWELATLGVNYRTPAEIMEVAAEVRRLADPAFEPPRSVRSTGAAPLVRAVAHGRRSRRASRRAGDGARRARDDSRSSPRPAAARARRRAARRVLGRDTRSDPAVVLLDPRQAKGLEFDTVIVVDPGGDHGRLTARDERSVCGADPVDPATRDRRNERCPPGWPRPSSRTRRSRRPAGGGGLLRACRGGGRAGGSRRRRSPAPVPDRVDPPDATRRNGARPRPYRPGPRSLLCAVRRELRYVRPAAATPSPAAAASAGWLAGRPCAPHRLRLQRLRVEDVAAAVARPRPC